MAENEINQADENVVSTAEAQDPILTKGSTEQKLEDSKAPAGESPIDIEFLLDIPLQVRVEVGRCKMMINDLLQLGQGSVIELQKLVGEPFEVLVNEKLVARGEVVVVNERFGVRLTDIISPMERIQQLA
jgi:flagellar motor switch protein FliN/FliY